MRGNKVVLPIDSANPNTQDKKSPTESRKRTRDGKLVATRIDVSLPAITANGALKGLPKQQQAKLKENSKPPPKQKLLATRIFRGQGDETRSLRSKAGGSRLKSDLAIYFPNFEEVISGKPQDPGAFKKIIIAMGHQGFNNVSEYLKPHEPIRLTNTSLLATPSHSPQSQPATKPSSIKAQFEKIDLQSLVPANFSISEIDPMDDSVYLPYHSRAERREKQLRNIEKERAQHEKGQLESLLEALQGPDWLRTMGVTGITDGARKDYEPKRDYFVREVRVLLNKFRTWKEAEKRLQLEKAARHSSYEEEDDEAGHEDDTAGGAEALDDDSEIDHDLADNDMDAWAARQLRIEAQSARPQKRSKKAAASVRPKQPPKPPEPQRPFTSFFDKSHLRAAALAKSRPGRRTVLAFGRPLPEMDQAEFALPSDLLTDEVLRVHARKRRRMNREKKEEGED
jgi:hypothetical protein